MQVRALLQPPQRCGVEQLLQQVAVHRAYRAERAAGAPAAEIEIPQMLSAGGEHLAAHARSDAEDGIDTGERSGAHADCEFRRKREPVGGRLVESALPITAVPAARERDRIKHCGAPKCYANSLAFREQRNRM